MSGVTTCEAGVTIFVNCGSGGNIVIDTTPIVGGTIGNVLYHGAGNVVREYQITGTGKVVLNTDPSFARDVTSGVNLRALFGDGEEALQVEASAAGSGNDPAKIELTSGGDFLLVNGVGGLVGIKNQVEGFIARFSTGDLTDDQTYILPDQSGDLLVTGGSPSFEKVTIDNNTAGAGQTVFPVDAQGNPVFYIYADPNISIFNSGSFGSGVGVIFIANSTTVPTSDPTGGGILYVEAGALKYRGSGGTTTTIANA